MPRRPRGKSVAGPRGRPVRLISEFIHPHHYVGKHAPRGQTGMAYPFTAFLKERAPLVYVFVVGELKKPACERNTNVEAILTEWREATACQRPSARELTAFIVERALAGAWKVWRVKPPHTTLEADAFFRRYVHGHPGAIQAFRKALQVPQPWDRHHVGHELKWFLEARGEAARHYALLEPAPARMPFLRIIEE